MKHQNLDRSVDDRVLQAAITAVAAYLHDEDRQPAERRALWAAAVRPDAWDAGRPWPVNTHGWAQAERPR